MNTADLGIYANEYAYCPLCGTSYPRATGHTCNPGISVSFAPSPPPDRSGEILEELRAIRALLDSIYREL